MALDVLFIDHRLVVVAGEPVRFDIVVFGCCVVVDGLVVVRREAMALDVRRLVLGDGLVVVAARR